MYRLILTYDFTVGVIIYNSTVENKEKPDPWEVTLELKAQLAHTMKRIREKKANWINEQMSLVLVHLSTKETGTFAGLFGYLSGEGVKTFAYYVTDSGIYFYENYDMKGENKQTFDFHPEKLTYDGNPRLVAIEHFLE